MAICDLVRITPRTSTEEYDHLATSRPEPVDSPEFQAKMKELYDFIFKYCEIQHQKEEEGIEEDL